MNAEDFKQYAELVAKKRELKAVLKTLDETIAEREVALLDEMGAEGVTQMRVDTDSGAFTLFPKCTVWAGIEEGQKLKAIEVLEGLGMKDLLSPNYQSLSSWVREHIDAGVPLPKEFEGVIAVREVFSLAVRKANGR